MGIHEKQEGIERTLEAKAEEVTQYEQKSEEIENKLQEIESAIANISEDEAVKSTLENNRNERMREKQAEERNVAVLREELDSLLSLTAEVEKANAKSSKELDDLREIGENVSDAERIVEERQTWARETRQKIAELIQRLGGKIKNNASLLTHGKISVSGKGNNGTSSGDEVESVNQIEIGCGKGKRIKNDENNTECECKTCNTTKLATEKREKIKNYKLNPNNKTHPDLNEKAGQIGIDDADAKPYYYDYKGRKRNPVGSHHAGKVYTRKDGTYPTLQNGDGVMIFFDDAGFPIFKKWTSYESYLPEEYWKEKDTSQFQYLNKKVYDDIIKNQKKKNELMQGMFDTIKEGPGYKYGDTKFSAFLTNSKLKDGTTLEDKVKEYLTEKEVNDLKAGKASQKLYDIIMDEDRGKDLKEAFIEANMNRIKAKEDPIGYTWHHHQEFGRMQLVKTNIHELANHTGGRQTWGFGIRK